MARTYQLTGAMVITKARRILNDETATYRTADTEFIGWLNDALGMAVEKNPGLFTASATHTTTAGARQVIETARARGLLDVIGVPACDLQSLNDFAPGWQAGTAGAIKNWMPAEGDPLAFYCYPPASAGQSIPVSIVKAPAVLSAAGDLIPLPESLEPALVAFLVGMVESKDDEHAVSGRAKDFREAFAAMIARG